MHNPELEREAIKEIIEDKKNFYKEEEPEREDVKKRSTERVLTSDRLREVGDEIILTRKNLAKLVDEFNHLDITKEYIDSEPEV